MGLAVVLKVEEEGGVPSGPCISCCLHLFCCCSPAFFGRAASPPPPPSAETSTLPLPMPLLGRPLAAPLPLTPPADAGGGGVIITTGFGLVWQSPPPRHRLVHAMTVAVPAGADAGAGHGRTHRRTHSAGAGRRASSAGAREARTRHRRVPHCLRFRAAVGLWGEGGGGGRRSRAAVVATASRPTLVVVVR